jgi:hypothetical protein
MGEGNKIRLISLWQNKAGVRFLAKVFFFFIMCSLTLLSNLYAGSIKEEYELQERCKESADTWFEKQWGGINIHNTTNNQIIVTYKNHYNKKLNKCFLVEETTTVVHKKNNKKTVDYIVNLVLADINENKIYGEYTFTKFKNLSSIVNGYVIDFNSHNKATCNGRDEFESLIKPYMEE